MRRWVGACAVLVLLFPACRRTSPLVGRWVSVARKDGVATVVEFRPDGTMTSSWQTRQEYQYKMNGSQLLVSGVNPLNGESLDTIFDTRLTGTTLVLTSLLDKSQNTLERAGPPSSGDNPLAGEWQLHLKDGNTELYRFTADGKMLVSRTLRSAEGKYSSSGNSLTLYFQGQPPGPGTFHFEGNDLIIAAEKGTPQQYQRESSSSTP